MYPLLQKLKAASILSREEFLQLLGLRHDPDFCQELFAAARAVRHTYYGTDVYIRGLIEFTSYCKNDCYYCGLRSSNHRAERYRLTQEEILTCCRKGWQLGFRTFVLQGGEDPWYSPLDIARLVDAIKREFPACAVTLSLGEFPTEVYRTWFRAGADRYLLRHETAAPAHYRKLHPVQQTLENRMRCLWDLKAIGYQVGAGFMVGSPWQQDQDLVEDLLFLAKLQPQMVGIGPFIPHHDTPFAHMPAGTCAETVFLLAVLRLLLPTALLPATTALGTISPNGREQGMLAGANVVMPNLSPIGVRKKYLLYDHKACTGEEAAECLACLNRRMQSVGYRLTVSRGDPCTIPRTGT